MRSPLLFVLLLAVTFAEVRGEDLKPGTDKDPPKVDPVVGECNCEDELPADVCDATFVKVADNCGKLASAIKCAKSCKLCCKLKRYDCKDKTGDPPVKCQSVKEFGWCDSTDEPMRGIVNEWCQHTCGKCCEDDDVELCKYVKNDCKNPKTQAKCQLTCGICNSNGCLDAYDNCGALSSRCKDANLVDMMTKFCNKTCGICGSQRMLSVECKDNKAGCEAWAKNGFCSSPNYTVAVKREYCAKSCNLC